MAKYWTAPVPASDDFGRPVVDEFIDGRTQSGSWALMTPYSWKLYGCGKLGTGLGQRYRRDGAAFVKAEG